MSNETPGGYPGRERRPNALSEERATQMINEAVAQAIDTHDQDMRQFIKAEMAELSKLIRSAFPDGDPDGHRRAHEQEIASAKRWTAIKVSVMEKVVTGGVWGLISFLALAAWEHFKRGVNT